MGTNSISTHLSKAIQCIGIEQHQDGVYTNYFEYSKFDPFEENEYSFFRDLRGIENELTVKEIYEYVIELIKNTIPPPYRKYLKITSSYAAVEEDPLQQYYIVKWKYVPENINSMGD